MSTTDTASSDSADALRHPDGFRLDFPPLLEAEYRGYHYARIRQRVPAIGWSGIFIFVGYALFDSWALPPALSNVSVLLRLGLVCPLIVLVMWAARRVWPFERFLALYGLAFTVGGISVGVIVLLARYHGLEIPTQGLLLLLLFGYFLMAMPTRMVTRLSLSMTLVFLVAQSLFVTHWPGFAFECVFFLTANVLGYVGSFVQEKSLRAAFLDEQKLQRSQQQLLNEMTRRSLLLTHASHDLKQPLLAMGLMADELAQPLTPAERQTALDKLRGSLSYLGELTDNLLESSRIEAGHVQPQIGRVPLRRLVADILREASERFERGAITVENTISPAVVVLSDGLLLNRMVRNLVDNAIKHARPRHLWLRAERESRWVTLSIIDDGCGIMERDIERIFAPFHRGNSPTGGLGVGLSIVQQLSELLRHPLTVDSRPGQGTCFSLRLPIANPAASESGMYPANQSDVVMLDIREESLRESLAELLRQMHFEPRVLGAQTPMPETPRSPLPTPPILAILRQTDRGICVVDPGAARDTSPPERTLDVPIRPARLRLMLESLREER